MNPDAIMQQIMQQIIQGNQSQLDGLPQMNMPAMPTPEEMKRERLRSALAAAGQSLATTPGNFMTGMAAGSGAAAQAYGDAKKGERDQAMEHYNAVEKKRMELMDQIFGGADRMVDNKRADRSQARADAQYARGVANDEYRRGRDKIEDERYEETLARTIKQQEEAAKVAAEQRKRDAMIEVEKLLSNAYKNMGLDDPALYGDDRTAAQQQFNALQQRLQGAMGGGSAGGQQYQIGQTATGRNGEKIVFTENGWVPQQ